MTQSNEQLLKEYSKEVYGNDYEIYGIISVSKLIDSHRSLREKSLEWHDEYLDAHKKGFEAGYNSGLKQAANDTIHYNDLRTMTIQDLVNLIGEQE